MCVVFFLQLKTPILLFSCPYKFFHVTPQADHEDVQVLNTSYSYCLFLVKLSGFRQSQGIYMRFHLNVELLFLPNEKGAKSSGVKSCLQVEMKGGAWWAEIPQHEINRIYSD